MKIVCICIVWCINLSLSLSPPPLQYSPPGLVVVDNLVNSPSLPREALSPNIDSDSSTVVNDDEVSPPRQLADSKPQSPSSEVPVCYDLVALSGDDESVPLTSLSKDDLSVTETLSSESLGTALLPPDSVAPLTTSLTDSEVYSSINLPPLVASSELNSFCLALPKFVVSLPSAKSVFENNIIEGSSLKTVTDKNGNKVSSSSTLGSVDGEEECVDNSVESDSLQATVSTAETSSTVAIQNSKSYKEIYAPFYANPCK